MSRHIHAPPRRGTKGISRSHANRPRALAVGHQDDEHVLVQASGQGGGHGGLRRRRSSFLMRNRSTALPVGSPMSALNGSKETSDMTGAGPPGLTAGECAEAVRAGTFDRHCGCWPRRRRDRSPNSSAPGPTCCTARSRSRPAAVATPRCCCSRPPNALSRSTRGWPAPNCREADRRWVTSKHSSQMMLSRTRLPVRRFVAPRHTLNPWMGTVLLTAPFTPAITAGRSFG
jgi:hypothetical protein